MVSSANEVYYTGVGRRKSAVATIRLTSGRGEYRLNSCARPLPEELAKVLALIDKEKSFDISSFIKGGGITSRAEAERLALARSLLKVDPSLRATLRKAGLLTVDSRVKERMKPGLKRARRAPQWAKR